ncbi:unnamed protein product [Sphagnum balticum]
MSFGLIAVGVGTAVSAGVGLYDANKQAGIEGQALSMAQTTQAEQQQYNQQLMQLMQNPSSFLNSSIFQSSLNQGLSGVSRQMAAQGYSGSGNEATALEQYGQTQASGQLLGQEQLLAGLSGLQSSTSTGQSLSVASQAQSTSFNQLGSVLASLGYAAGSGGSNVSNAYNNLFGGASGYTTGSAGFENAGQQKLADNALTMEARKQALDNSKLMQSRQEKAIKLMALAAKPNTGDPTEDTVNTLFQMGQADMKLACQSKRLKL